MREFYCRSCEFAELLTDSTALAWVRRAGKFRRVDKPRTELVYEILETSISELPCPECDRKSVQLQERPELDGEWPEVRLCEVCKTTIPAERLELFPKSTRCANCRDVADPTDVEYCPRCGAIMKVVQRGRTSTYQLTCSECRHVAN